MESKQGRFVVDLNTIWDLEDKRTNELRLKNAIERTEKNILYTRLDKLDYWETTQANRHHKWTYRGR